MSRETFLSQGFTAPARQDTVQMGHPDWKNPNDLTKSARDNADFLSAIGSNLIGDVDKDSGKLKSNGLLGRKINEENDNAILAKQEERLKEAEEAKNRAIMSAYENLDSASFAKMGDDISKATGIEDPQEAKQLYTRALQQQGFNSIEHLAEVHSAFTTGKIAPGTPRYTQLKNMFSNNDKFINGALAIYSAEQNYNRRAANPLTQQDKIDMATFGLKSGLYTDFNAAMRDMNLRNEYTRQNIEKEAQIRAQAINAFPDYQGGKEKTTSQPSFRSYNKQEFLGSKTTEETTKPLLEEEETLLDERNLKNGMFLPDSDMVEKWNQFYTQGYGTETDAERNDPSYGEAQKYTQSRLAETMQKIDKDNITGVSDDVNQLVNKLFEAEEMAIEDNNMIKEGFLPEGSRNRLNMSKEKVNNVLNQIQTIENKLSEEHRKLAREGDKTKLEEFKKKSDKLRKTLNSYKSNYQKIANNYNEFLGASGNSANGGSKGLNQEENKIYKSISNGESFDSMIDKEPDKEKRRTLEYAKQIAEDRMKTINPKGDKKLQEVKQKVGGNYPIIVATLDIAEQVLNEGAFEQLRSQLLDNAMSDTPSISELKVLSEKGAPAGKVAKALAGLFEGKGDLRYKNNSGVDYSKFTNNIRNAIMELVKGNFPDTNTPEFYYMVALSKNKAGIPIAK